MRHIAEITKESIIEPAKRNITLVALLSGVLLIGIGIALGGSAEGSSTIQKLADTLRTVGTTILGGGVLGAIVKSSQFSEIFQKHLFTVFTEPEKIVPVAELRSRWGVMTTALMKNVIGEPHHIAAADLIAEQLLENDAKSFHYEDMVLTYDINVAEDGVEVTAVNQLWATIVPAPGETPVFRQKFRVNGQVTLQSILIEDTPINDFDEYLTVDPENPDVRELSIDLSKYKRLDGKVKVERTLTISQSLHDEPYFAANISRYIRGGKVRAKVNDGYKLVFRKTGVTTTKSPVPVEENDYLRWPLARPDRVALPGQGFVLVLVREMKDQTEVAT